MNVENRAPLHFYMVVIITIIIIRHIERWDAGAKEEEKQ